MTDYQKGQQLFAGPDDTETLTEARAYITDMGFTADDIKLVRCNGQVLIVAL